MASSWIPPISSTATMMVVKPLASSHGLSGYRKELELKSVIHTNATANRNIDLYTDVEIFIVQMLCQYFVYNTAQRYLFYFIPQTFGFIFGRLQLFHNHLSAITANIIYCRNPTIPFPYLRKGDGIPQKGRWLD